MSMFIMSRLASDAPLTNDVTFCFNCPMPHSLPSTTSWLVSVSLMDSTLLRSMSVVSSCLSLSVMAGSMRDSPLSVSIEVMIRKNTSRMNEMSAVDVVLSWGTERFSRRRIITFTVLRMSYVLRFLCFDRISVCVHCVCLGVACAVSVSLCLSSGCSPITPE